MILPPATLGLLGGGQLGRYFVMAAHRLGYRVAVLDPDPDSVAGRIAEQHLMAAYDDTQALTHLASFCAAISTEFENVPAAALRHLAGMVPVRPAAAAVEICQDRRLEKAFLCDHGNPVAPYAEIQSEAELAQVPDDLFPGILKLARLGYDGKGQYRVENHAEALAALRQCGGAPCVLEKKLPLELEVSVVLARDEHGNIASFPVAQNTHRDGILDVTQVPAADLGGAQMEQAMSLAARIARQMDYVGILAVEFFVVAGALYVNELAPRPHNSGHYTLDACLTSQFEQQVRALCGLPLGDPSAHSAALMVNILGDLWYPGADDRPQSPAWHALLERPEIRLHLYGKEAPRCGRKMGHFTVLGPDVLSVAQAAQAARSAIGMPPSEGG